MGWGVLRVPPTPALENHSVSCCAHGIGGGFKVRSSGTPRIWSAKGEWLSKKVFFLPWSSDLHYILQLGWKRHCWFSSPWLFTSRSGGNTSGQSGLSVLYVMQSVWFNQKIWWGGKLLPAAHILTLNLSLLILFCITEILFRSGRKMKL